MPWGTRRALASTRRGTGLYGVALLFSAAAGFAAAPAAGPYLARLAAIAGVLLPMASHAEGRPESPLDPGGPSAGRGAGSGPAENAFLSPGEWGRRVLDRVTQAVWPAPRPSRGPTSQAALPVQPPASGAHGGDGPAASPAPVPSAPRPAPPASDGRVWVAVYHTHASEMYRTGSFAPEDPEAYHRFGTPDTGVVRVGARLVRALNEYGIPAVHVTTLHDTPDFRDAYARSLETARALVRRYPSLRLLIDLHRDAPQEGGELLASVEGEEVARIAIVVGSGDGGREGAPNLQAARLLAQELDLRFPGLLRRIMVHPGRRYNQQVHPGALLVEIGSYRSREEAALRAARLLAQAVAAMLLSHPFPRASWT